MSSEEPIRSVPDELFRKVSAKPERQLPDALFGPPPAPREPEATSDGASGTAVENGGGSESADESDAEGDGSGDIVTGAQPQANVGGDTSSRGTGNDASAPIADSAEAFGASVASAVDESAVDVIAESVATAAEEFAPVLDEPAVDGSGGAAIFAAPAPAAAATESSAATTEPAGSGEPEPAPAESATTVSESATADEPAETREAARPVLLVIADSLSYFGPKGGLPADHPRIWPNLVAAELDWDVELVARIGWTCRDAYWALIGDPRVWAAVPRAGAVVFAVGGMDTLPSPLPTALRELIRYVRPPALRRVVRATYNWLQPKLSKLGRPVALPPKVSVDYLEQCRTALAQLRPDLPVVAVLPSVHDCAAYGRVHSGRPRAVEALRAWSGRTSVPLVDLGEAVRDNIFSGEANPDGIHWGWDGHTAVANAMVKTLQEVR
ncbi:hypothetical protein IFM12275_49280 [Nocardia sputorum]|uniref:SGNH hydrolase-type esterase domain-containing protein n=1 Tax=Nocardia sputorum TaxID=2984338 RepID=A0ABN6U9B6_9NOCA|nr:diglucosylglycerate octanoyltransferase [Nocardia sputorum]BDT94952.1 hypothetical protein IFM12275_49280 [Nocardia sputorum]BDU01797.1 hypothetical protein IFM12276_48250 [Nocardia sputorum]